MVRRLLGWQNPAKSYRISQTLVSLHPREASISLRARRNAGGGEGGRKKRTLPRPTLDKWPYYGKRGRNRR